MMKNIFFVIALLSGFYMPEVHAQDGNLSVGLGFSRSRYASFWNYVEADNRGVNDEMLYPVGEAKYFPRMDGARLSFMYGIKNFRVNFGYGYYLKKEIDYKKYYVQRYYGITSQFSVMEWDCDFVYYPFNFSSYEFGGIYVLAGGTVRYHVFDSDFSQTTPATVANWQISEAKLFDDKRVIGTHVNVGLGAEVAIPNTMFLLYAEGRIGIHTNAYVRYGGEGSENMVAKIAANAAGLAPEEQAINRETGELTGKQNYELFINKSYATIRTTQLVDFWSISTGFRYLIPRKGENPHSRNPGRGRIKTTNRGRTHSKKRK